MKIRSCLRCGSTNLQKGVIYDYYYYLTSKTPLTFNWLSDQKEEFESTPLEAILCKSCGHVELVVDADSLIEYTRLTCPHCKAIYSYRIKAEESPIKVRCANCNKEFKVYSRQSEAKSDELIDAIEKDLIED
ncbi:MAG: MJ0042-type zinc finger domain-containing protein [Candidatus Odinarchaeota archaeon]